MFSRQYFTIMFFHQNQSPKNRKIMFPTKTAKSHFCHQNRKITFFTKTTFPTKSTNKIILSKLQNANSHQNRKNKNIFSRKIIFQRKKQNMFSCKMCFSVKIAKMSFTSKNTKSNFSVKITKMNFLPNPHKNVLHKKIFFLLNHKIIFFTKSTKLAFSTKPQNLVLNQNHTFWSPSYTPIRIFFTRTRRSKLWKFFLW